MNSSPFTKVKLLKATLVSLSTSIIALYIFFGPLLKNPNTIYFANNHDGLQNYYGHIYHVKYDSSYIHTTHMNYPYGEMIYYTGEQLIPVTILKYISNNFYDISDQMIGIQNLSMLFSIVIAAFFICLIFLELGVGWITAALGGTLIAFLSPQLDRFGGHFSLAYVFVVPLFIYLILRFSRKPGIILSFIICLTSFWAFTTHPYFYGMNSAFLLFYWIYAIKTKRYPFKYSLSNAFIQIILPYILAQIIPYLFDYVADRTGTPWGFLFYRAYPEGVFLPFGKPYGQFLYSIFTQLGYLQWEGIAYVGLLGIFAFGMILRHWIISLKLKTYKRILSPTDNEVLNSIFWGSFFALLYSFGLPFILGLQALVNYSGPLKQMRGIGRFTWPFFYTINIIGIYIIWSYLKEKNKTALISIVLILLGYDAYLNARNRVASLNNSLPELQDTSNQLPENEWAKIVDASKYQAIIPIPQYNSGSENIWIDSGPEGTRQSFIFSLKTGLPNMAIFLSRTSISQSLNCYQVACEPYRKPEILKDCKSTKPFLLMVLKADNYRKGEAYLMSKGKLIYKGSKFDLYDLGFKILEHSADSLAIKAQNRFLSSKLFKHDSLFSSNELVNYAYESFDTLKNGYKSYMGKACFSSSSNGYQSFFEGNVPNYDTSKTYLLSFWYGNIKCDLHLRAQLIITKMDSTGKAYDEINENIGKWLKIVDGNWGLCENTLKLNNKSDKVKLTLRSKELGKCNYLVDEIFIKPENTDIFKQTHSGIIKDNRLYNY